MDQVSHSVFSNPTLEQLYYSCYIFQGVGVILFFVNLSILSDWHIVGVLEMFSDGGTEPQRSFLTNEWAMGSAFQSGALAFISCS